jgi:hypothetical protein
VTDLNSNEAKIKKIKMANSKKLNFLANNNSQYFFAKISGSISINVLQYVLTLFDTEQNILE